MVVPLSPMKTGSVDVFPHVPAPAVLWRAFSRLVWVLLALWVLDGTVDLIVFYWFTGSIELQALFWTNLRSAASLFVAGGGLLALAVAVPMARYADDRQVRSGGFHVACWAFLIGGRLLAGRYQELLLARHGGSFAAIDPVFGHDIGFFVFRLPLLWIVLEVAFLATLLAMASLLVARFDTLRSRGLLSRDKTLEQRAGLLLDPGFNFLFYVLGFLGAAGTWLSRYDLLFRDNEASGIRAGAEFLDVEGLFSTVHALYFTALVEVGVTLTIGYTLTRLYRSCRHLETSGEAGAAMTWRAPLTALVALLTADAAFITAVAIRDRITVMPNEPYVQREHIQRHMDATLKGYGLTDVEVVEWTPPESSLQPEDILASRTVQGAPILPGYVSYIESESPDIQQATRFEITDTDMIYGPMLEIYEQQQQLRPYYRFLDVDAVRYRVDGERRMFVSAAREIPSLKVVGPQDWLQHWGTSTLLYTHGLGLVMSPSNRVDSNGQPEYVLRDVPPASSLAPFEGVEPRLYYGEGGTGSYALTNIRHLKEFDYATEQARAEFVLPENEPAGLRIDTIFKRIVFALWSVQRSGNDLTAFLFSSYIDRDKTRIHLNRSPLERARAVAPFLFLDDSDVYAVMADGRIQWMLNAMTTSRNYPYSLREELGDKASDRSHEELRFPTRIVNYAEDSVKITLDALSGVLRFYKIADGPIVDTWARVYPDLFTDASQMPASVRAQMTYPMQWFHVQFDDVYKRFHQRNYIEFYNLEDLWDDGDEVLGPIGVGLEGFGTHDEATFSYEPDPILVDVVDLPGGSAVFGQEDDLQFARVMPFTPEGARNLRSLIVALQDGDRYGELYSLRVPQGTFVSGPEQADAMIDADARVNQQLTLWVRHGAQVMAGHTLLLPVAGDVVYIQPIWVKSAQNAIPQIRLFAVVYRERVTMASRLEDAIRLQGLSPRDTATAIVGTAAGEAQRAPGETVEAAAPAEAGR